MTIKWKINLNQTNNYHKIAVCHTWKLQGIHAIFMKLEKVHGICMPAIKRLFDIDHWCSSMLRQLQHELRMPQFAIVWSLLVSFLSGLCWHQGPLLTPGVFVGNSRQPTRGAANFCNNRLSNIDNVRTCIYLGHVNNVTACAVIYFCSRNGAAICHTPQNRTSLS